MFNPTNPHTVIEEEDDVIPLTSKHAIHMCYKDVQSSLQTLRHCLEKMSIVVMHVVKKVEKLEKKMDLLHANQLQHTSINAFFHPKRRWKQRNETPHLYFTTSFNGKTIFYLRYIYKCYLLTRQTLNPLILYALRTFPLPIVNRHTG